VKEEAGPLRAPASHPALAEYRTSFSSLAIEALASDIKLHTMVEDSAA
jgi:hypothetical protein